MTHPRPRPSGVRPGIRSALVAAFLFLLAPPMHAQPVSRAADPRVAADRVLELLAREDSKDLIALAKSYVPDPWLVADELCARGEFDAATRFAGCTTAPSLDGLPAFVAAQQKDPTDAARREVLADADAAARGGDLGAALEVLERASVEPRDVLSVRLIHERGNILRGQKDLRGAREAYRQARARAEQMGWTLRAANLSVSIGLACKALGDFRAGIDAWEKASDGFETVGYEKQRGLVCEELGQALEGDLRYHRAIRAYATARDVFARLGIERGVAVNESRLALASYRVSDYAAALTAYESALERFERIGDEKGEATTAQNLGLALWRVGSIDEALAAHERARALYRKTGQPGKAILALVSTIHILVGEGRLDEAARLLARAEAISEADHGALASRLLGLRGNLASLRGDPDAAEDAYRRAAARAVAEGDREAGILAGMGLANVLLGRGDASGAVAGLESLLEEARTDVRLLASLRANLAVAELENGDPAAAIATARAVFAVAEELRPGLTLEEVAREQRFWRGAYFAGVTAAIRTGDVPSLWYFVEVNRGRTVRESIGGHDALRAVEVPESVAAETRRTEVELVRAREGFERARAAGGRAGIASARAVLDAAVARHDEAIRRLDRRRRQAADMSRVEPGSVEEFRRSLDERTAYVGYALVPEGAVALVVTRSDARIVSLGSTAGIVAAAEMADPTGAAPDLAKARARLVEPLELGEAIRRVVVAPVGPLAVVPPSLLFPDRDVAFVPSASTWAALRTAPESGGEGVLAFGDPACPPDPAGGAGTAGATGGLSPLPATRGEVRAIGTLVRIGAEASETRLREDLASPRRWRAVHFACHGLVDPDRPMLSSLALARTDEDDGYLSASEIATLEVSADLVTLSACETARGVSYDQEGLVGLPSALMVAGAPRVLASLWKVDDAATAVLMKAFYAAWRKDGASAASALRAAQKVVRSEPQWADPRYWAAWVLWGRPD